MNRSARFVIFSAGALGVLVVVSARTVDVSPVATEVPPASTVPPSSVPAPIVPVEPSTTTPSSTSTTAAPGSAQPGEGRGAPSSGEWPKVDGQGCTTPWGDEEPAWCDPRVFTWIRADGTCWVTPAGVASGRVCPTRETTTTAVGRLPETAAGSRWA